MPKISLALRTLVCFIFVFLPLSSMDQWFYDHLFRIRGAQHRATPIVLVRVNDSAVYPFSTKGIKFLDENDLYLGPKNHLVWHEKFYRELIDRIRADKPRLIVFGSYYDGVESSNHPSLDQSDLLFSAALNEENKLIPPPSGLTTSENYGFANIFPDSDNVVRRSYLVYSSGASLALRVYHRLNKAPIKRDLLEPLYIDYRGASPAYPSYDATDLLDEPKIDEASPVEGRFSDKIVVIGREGSVFSDLETPFGKMPRLEIQANVIDTFMGNREIHILPRWVNLVTAAIAVTVSIAIILYYPLTLAWVFLLLLALATLLLALFLFSQFKLWAGVANPIFCIFGTHLLLLGYKVSRQEEAQWKIQQEAETLKEMDQFKNNFISLFSHDLKTPIAKIQAVTSRVLAEHRELPVEVQNSLKTIDRTNAELARLISDILKVTKMESMRLEPAHEVVDLNRLVETAISRLRFLADEKQILLIVDLEPLFSIEGDQKLIEEVITNLVENALKYSPPSRKVVVRTTEEESRVRVTVIDEGPGIPAEELPRVTGKFYRGKQAAEKTKGSGLGLYLSKYFVELHHGELTLHSELGKGTTVDFWLPIPS